MPDTVIKFYCVSTSNVPKAILWKSRKIMEKEVRSFTFKVSNSNSTLGSYIKQFSTSKKIPKLLSIIHNNWFFFQTFIAPAHRLPCKAAVDWLRFFKVSNLIWIAKRHARISPSPCSGIFGATSLTMVLIAVMVPAFALSKPLKHWSSGERSGLCCGHGNSPHCMMASNLMLRD